jgi:hypothetical protein
MVMKRIVRRLRDRRGVALPVALVGLVAVSLLVTSALLTSATEGAISAAQSSSARALYDAEGGVQQYLTQVVAGTVALQAGTSTVALANGANVAITTTRMRHTPFGTAGGFTATYAVRAEALSEAGAARGRAVIAMVNVTRPPPNPMQTNITSAITLGGDLHVNGNAFTVSGYDACSSTDRDVQAVRSARDSEITTNNTNHMSNFEGKGTNGSTTANGWNAIERTSLTKEQLAENVLGGTTISALIATLPSSKKWGPRFSRPRWGGTLLLADKVAVVDGEGGLIDVNGGTGVLIVVNGGVRMRGNATFNGIIIAEGNFDLKGTPTVAGALISLSTDGINEIEMDAAAIGAGHVTVQYDKCKVDAAQAGFGSIAQSTTPNLDGPTFAWFEVVR